MNYLKKIKCLTSFLLNSKTIYRAHSPFLFELINDCFYKTPDKDFIGKVESLRNELKHSNKIIQINDFGASKNRTKTVKQIAKTSLTSKKRSEIIHQIIKKYNCSKTIELGTNLGVNTIYMASANSNGLVYSIEGCKNIYDIAKENIQAFNLKNIELINNTFENSLPKIFDELETFDFIYIDGNHTYEATMNYFNLCLKHKHNESIILFDDIYWSEGMRKAWREITDNKEVSLSINYFYSGLVFFKRELSKENFYLRYKNFFKTR